MDVLMWNREPVGGPIALIDQAGRPRTEADFRDRLLLIYFGYTACPDVCPTDLMEIGRAPHAARRGRRCRPADLHHARP
ncbi:protein of unknown function [Methylorubrum extorquens]|uniref:Electron transport protein SCO1/SenC n=1 Tax=Methylorubrum extorquens TaxID=408 RepID=A0A2N9ALC8_METEX|nr:protein of unknown function [Methylorubrum extorquens]